MGVQMVPLTPDSAGPKGQLNLELIYEVIVFLPKCNPKITKISALPYKQGS